jgi:hypothetical protein
MQDAFEEKGKIYTQVVTKSPIKAIIQTTTNRISGNIHVRPDDRLKDALDTADNFLAVTDASVQDKDGKEIILRANFMAINLSQIVWVVPEEEIITGE